MMGIKRLLQQQQLANKEKEIIRENQQVSETNISSCDQNLEVDSSTVNDRTVNEVTKDSKESNENNSSCCSQQLLGEVTAEEKDPGDSTESRNSDDRKSKNATDMGDTTVL